MEKSMQLVFLWGYPLRACDSGFVRCFSEFWAIALPTLVSFAISNILFFVREGGRRGPSL